MHGRIKVRTTAEQAEAKRKEREKKLKIYNQTTGRLFEKRKNGELDTEALSLSEQILASNPDFSTLWNFRREIFQDMKDENPTDLLQNTCLRELSFLKSCLQVNPKSYSVWHHREWIMEFMPQPNWKEELHLCNLFLSFDERNFHCWDYRRYTVKKANESAEDEFNFSTAKIKENFSNYSSWHYRSKLLPLIHPDPSGDKERVEEQALMKEFELAQNAFFTDPYDQSAWFYHRWLLGRAQPHLDISCFYVKRLENSLSIVFQFNQPFQILKESPVMSVDEHEVTGEWCNPFHNNHPSKVWSLCSSSNALNVANDVTFSVKFANRNLERSVVLNAGESETWNVASDSYLFRAELTAVQSSVLQKELDSCRLLLEEEPDNKCIDMVRRSCMLGISFATPSWGNSLGSVLADLLGTMLTMVLLMRAVDPLLYEKETNSYLEKLTSVDSYRQEYYKDLGRKFKLENLIEKHRSKDAGYKEDQSRVLDLTNMDLTFLPHMDQLVLMKNVNLSQNQITSLDECNMLRCAEVLDASSNKLRRVTRRHALTLPSLQELSLSNNHIPDVKSLNCLQECHSLRKLDLRGNPCCESGGYREEIRTLLPSLRELDGEPL